MTFGWPAFPLLISIGLSVSTERSASFSPHFKTAVQIFSSIDGINWSMRTLLYSHNQRAKTRPSLYLGLNISVSSLNAAVRREIFSNCSIVFKIKFSFKKNNKICVKILVVGLRFTIQYAFWRSNAAFNGPLIRKSNRLFLAGYTIIVVE